MRQAAPDAQETISYRIPAFRQNGILVYFAAFRHHIGFYPPVQGDAALQQAAAPYAGEKGNLRFPLDQPLPLDLIERITRLRVQQDLAKAAQARTRPAPAPADMPPPSPSLTPADALRALREDIQAENTLIASRVTWYVTSQAFLLTAYATSWNAGFVWPGFFHRALPIAAIVLSAVILASIMRATWAQGVVPARAGRAGGPHPGRTGPGRPRAHRARRLPAHHGGQPHRRCRPRDRQPHPRAWCA